MKILCNFVSDPNLVGNHLLLPFHIDAFWAQHNNQDGASEHEQPNKPEGNEQGISAIG
jgi:hypothetical protein